MYSRETPDGTFFISGGKDNKVLLRDAETGDWIGTFEGHQGAVWGCAINGAATLAVSGSADFSAMLWDCITGDALHTFTHKHIVRAVALSEDSSRMLTGGHEKILRVFDVQQADSDPVELAGHTGVIKHALWTADLNLILSSGEDCTLRLWDLRSGKTEAQHKNPGALTSLQLSWDAKTLVSTCASLCTVSFATMNNLRPFQEFTRGQKVETAALHPREPLFLVGGDDLWVHMANYTSGADVDELKGHHGPVHCVQFHPNGQTYASGSEDGTVRIWRTSVADTLAQMRQQEKSEPTVTATADTQP